VLYDSGILDLTLQWKSCWMYLYLVQLQVKLMPVLEQSVLEQPNPSFIIANILARSFISR
jgi:hypothetical protein